MATLWLTVIVGMMWTGLGVIDERAISYLGTDSRSVGLFRTGLTVAALAMAAFAWFVGRNLSTRPSFLTVFLVGFGLSKVGQAPLAEIVPALVFHVWVVAATVWSGSTAGTPMLQKSF